MLCVDGRSGRACKTRKWAIGTNIHPAGQSFQRKRRLGTGVQIGALCGGRRGRGTGRRVRAARARGGCAALRNSAPNNVFFQPFLRELAAIRQDYTFRGERVELQVGSGKHFSRACKPSAGEPRKGRWVSRGLAMTIFFLAYSHVGHDCQIGNNTFVRERRYAGRVT